MQKLRVEFWNKIRSIPVEDLIFIDEAGVNLALIRLYGRALRGQRARGTRPQKRGKNVSMIAAIAHIRDSGISQFLIPFLYEVALNCQ